MISTINYVGDGNSRVFPVSFEIMGEDYVVIFLNNVAVVDRTHYDIINNSIVFVDGQAPATGTSVEIVVATDPTEIGNLNAPPSNVQTVLDNLTNINAVAANKTNIDTVASNTTNVTTVSNNIVNINSVATNIVPNLAEILQADTNATIATTKASEASASATSASNSATTATNQATIATTKASEASASETSASNSATTATTKANEASASATSASNSATSASNSATTATNKANEASSSASAALTSANNASTSETMAYKWSSNPVDTIVETDKYSAFHWATKAQEWANSVDASNIVHKTGDETIAGVKTFSSSPIVPTPTTDTQAANKGYVDSKPTLPIGAILNAYTIFNNCIVAFGGEFNRADYPKLWAYLQSNPSLLKTQAQWQTESTANGGICGFFSDGNGTTTFRVPNLDKAFLRPDSRTVGSFQGDAIRNITGGLDRNVTNGSPTPNGVFSFSQTNSCSVTGSTLPSGTLSLDASRVVPTAPENRPKNIAVLPLIVAK